MGYLGECICPACGYEQVFSLGSGRKDAVKKHAYAHFGMMDLWNIKVAELEKQSPVLFSRYRLGKCKDCGRLIEVPEVTFENGTTFHGSMCSCDAKREHEIQILSDEVGDAVICPICGGKMSLQYKGLWD